MTPYPLRSGRAFVAGWLMLGAFAGAMISAVEGWAQSAPADFTFKRVRVAPAGARPSIVQIDPEEQARLLATPPPRPDVAISAAPSLTPTAPSLFDWYWAEVSPALGPEDDRFAKALASLSKAPQGAAVPAPRLQSLQQVASAHGTDILKATIGTRVSPALVLAVIGIESGGRVDAVSSAGAVGLMQLIPATAARFGVKDSTDAAQNIKGGVAYLDWLLKEFQYDPLMALAAYNAGEGAVRKNGGVPPYAETRAYVPKVLAAWQVAQGLCTSPPELVTDPCIFKVISAGG